MVCETRLKPRQTISETQGRNPPDGRAPERRLAAGRIKAVVGPQGAVAFNGLSEAERDGVTDACAYRQLMITGSPLARAAIMRAGALAGRSVDRRRLHRERIPMTAAIAGTAAKGEMENAS